MSRGGRSNDIPILDMGQYHDIYVIFKIKVILKNYNFFFIFFLGLVS